MAPGHVAAAAALHGVVPSSGTPMDIATAQAIAFARGGQHADAARVFHEAVRLSPPGWAGWNLSVEPMLATWEHPDVWADVLALVRARAI